MHQKLVKMIVAGVQKGGTTSLFRYLQGHPQLRAPEQKELHFFDDESIDWNKPNYQILHSAFGGANLTGKAFEATPIYIFWPSALLRIKSYNPQMKLIFLFRDPIERAWSNWKMEIIRGRENLPFDIAIRDGRKRLESCDVRDRPWRLFSYLERGFFSSQVQTALELFPRRQLLFLRSNDLKLDHQNTLNSIADFLEIDQFPDLPARLDHRTKPVNYRLDAADVEFLRTLFYHDVMEFQRLTELRVSDWPTVNPNITIPN
jgi:Sulfotransferase domain